MAKFLLVMLNKRIVSEWNGSSLVSE